MLRKHIKPALIYAGPIVGLLLIMLSTPSGVIVGRHDVAEETCLADEAPAAFVDMHMVGHGVIIAPQRIYEFDDEVGQVFTPDIVPAAPRPRLQVCRASSSVTLRPGTRRTLIGDGRTAVEVLKSSRAVRVAEQLRSDLAIRPAGASGDGIESPANMC